MVINKRLTIFYIFLVFSFPLFGQGYNIDLSISGYTQKTAYLGYHFGDQKIIIDTVTTIENFLNFSDNKKLSGGLYFVQLENRKTFNFIVDGKQQNLILKTKLSDMQGKLKVPKSVENKLFVKYLKGQTKFQKKYADNSYRYQQEIRNYSLEVIEKNPNTFFAQYLKLLYNSTVKSEYFSSFDFSDERILKTDIYQSKIKYYLDTYAKNNHETIISETRMIIEKSEANKAVFKYTSEYIFSRYDKPNNISTKKVYLFLAKTYFISKRADWVKEERLNIIIQNADIYQYNIALYHNTIELYEKYLKDFKNGSHKIEADNAIEELKYEIAKNSHTVTSYQLYLKEYPEGKHKAQSETAIEDLKFHTAKNANTISAFNQYLTEYPTGIYEQTALKFIEDLKYEHKQKAKFG